MAPILIAKGATDLLLLPQMANRRGLIAGATGTLRESANQADKIRKVLYDAGRWYRQNLPRAHKHIRRPVSHIDLPLAQIRWALFILISLIFSKFFYLESNSRYAACRGTGTQARG
jgi:hypothetical protein